MRQLTKAREGCWGRRGVQNLGNLEVFFFFFPTPERAQAVVLVGSCTLFFSVLSTCSVLDPGDPCTSGRRQVWETRGEGVLTGCANPMLAVL